MENNFAHHARQRGFAGSRQRAPSACRAARACRAGTLRRIDDKLERKMREGVRHHAGQAAPLPPSAAHRAVPSRHRTSRAIRSSALRSCRRAALLRGACAAGCGRPRATRRTRHRAATRRSSSRLARKALLIAARARRAGALHGQITQAGASACRSWRRDPSSPGRSRRRGAAASVLAASARMRGFAPGSSSSTANSRAITRSILPSTGLACRSNAIAAIAAAV